MNTNNNCTLNYHHILIFNITMRYISTDRHIIPRHHHTIHNNMKCKLNKIYILFTKIYKNVLEFISMARRAGAPRWRVSRSRYGDRNTCLHFEHFGYSGRLVSSAKCRIFLLHIESPKTNSCRCRYNILVSRPPGRLHCTPYMASAREKIL